MFSFTIVAILYINLGKVYHMVLALTDVPDEVGDVITSHLKDTAGWIALVVVLFLVANIIISIIYTHRLVGPTYAFRRHIRSLAEGRYSARTFLRKNDAFVEVADELNHLAEVLERKSAARK